MEPPFERSVFINCPFDEDYAYILQAIAFCVVFMGFHPRLAPENPDNGAARLDRIVELVRGSRFMTSRGARRHKPVISPA